MINVGVVGFGYWGPNLVRSFNSNERSTIKAVCDFNKDALAKAKCLYPHIETYGEYNDLISCPDIDAIAIATPVTSHFELAKSALENGKHIFVEKPFTASVEEAEELINLSKKNNLLIMVDHTFLFTGAVKKIKELIDEDIMGDILYYDSTRVNLGLFQNDVNVVWDLAPHDLSIIDYIIKKKPISISAQGIDHFGRGQENIAYITMQFEEKMIAHININWMSPVKIRSTLIGGQKKMLVWNDLKSDDKIKVYDKGVDVDNKESIYKLLVDYRSGDMWSPKLDMTEALKVEVNHFIDCIDNNTVPINDGECGLRIVKMLLAANESLKNEGKMIRL